MRIPARRLAAAVAVLALLGTAPAGAVEPDEVVGGPDLAARDVVVAPGAPALPEVAAASWLVADLDTGEVLAAKDPHGRYAPASTLKALTALALLPELAPGRTVVPTFDDVNVEGSKVGIVERVRYPVSELFAGLLMSSGNDAANALATAAGGQARTARLMNARAAALHAVDTHAVNPHGLDAKGQTSSAYDLALIARAGLQDPDFARHVSRRSGSISAPGGRRIQIRNHNRLLGRYPGALGVKNGFTSSARASFVGAAERDDRRLVVTLMRSVPRVFDEAVKLLDWGFAAQGVEPVGALVPPVGEDPPAQAEVPTQEVAADAAPPARGRDDATSLPVTLAGMALAAAAVAVAGPGRGAQRRTSPAGRPAAADRGRTARRPPPRAPARRAGSPAARRR